MVLMTRILPALVLAALACACTTPGSMVGASEADLRAKMGAPRGDYANGDGSRTLSYPTGPLGTETYMAEVAPGGQVWAVRNALNDETFQRINPGMTRDEVLRLIGPPRDSARFPNLNQDSWEYYFQDSWGYRALFFVNFDPSGIVVSKFTRRLDYDRDRR
jgi:hypothetical protein